MSHLVFYRTIPAIKSGLNSAGMSHETTQVRLVTGHLILLGAGQRRQITRPLKHGPLQSVFRLITLFSSPEWDESVRSAPIPLLEGLGLRSASFGPAGTLLVGLAGARKGRAAKKCIFKGRRGLLTANEKQIGRYSLGGRGVYPGLESVSSSFPRCRSVFRFRLLGQVIKSVIHHRKMAHSRRDLHFGKCLEPATRDNGFTRSFACFRLTQSPRFSDRGINRENSWRRGDRDRGRTKRGELEMGIAPDPCGSRRRPGGK